MDRVQKNELYDKICMELTNYENAENTEEVDRGFLEEFYLLLVKIQNCWGELTSSED